MRRKIISSQPCPNSINIFNVQLSCGHKSVAQGHHVSEQNRFCGELGLYRAPKTTNCEACDRIKESEK